MEEANPSSEWDVPIKTCETQVLTEEAVTLPLPSCYEPFCGQVLVLIVTSLSFALLPDLSSATFPVSPCCLSPRSQSYPSLPILSFKLPYGDRETRNTEKGREN